MSKAKSTANPIKLDRMRETSAQFVLVKSAKGCLISVLGI
jgi:hypothetical protein